jgi:serine/threonine protein kinase
MVQAFQDTDNLYLVMQMQSGGDLRYHLITQKTFSEHQTKFLIACMISALSYLHDKLIIHRDIKPENLVFDSLGYLKITDFGIARIWQKDNSKESSGTPGYMAPEVMCK